MAITSKATEDLNPFPPLKNPPNPPLGDTEKYDENMQTPVQEMK